MPQNAWAVHSPLLKRADPQSTIKLRGDKLFVLCRLSPDPIHVVVVVQRTRVPFVSAPIPLSVAVGLARRFGVLSYLLRTGTLLHILHCLHATIGPRVACERHTASRLFNRKNLMG